MTKDDPVPPMGQYVFMLIVIAVAGVGFVYKFMKFAETAIEGQLLGFAVVPLVVYILIATGYAFLLAWAVASGHYRNVEVQKDRMMDYELNGDDVEPLPHPGMAGLSFGAQVFNSAFLAASVGTLMFLMWTMFQPPQSTGVLNGSAEVAEVRR